MDVVASLFRGRTAAAQCGLFTYKSVPVIFEPPCILHHVECYVCTIVSEELTVFIFSVFQGNICTCVPIYTVLCSIRLVSSSPPLGEPQLSQASVMLDICL